MNLNPHEEDAADRRAKERLRSLRRANQRWLKSPSKKSNKPALDHPWRKFKFGYWKG